MGRLLTFQLSTRNGARSTSDSAKHIWPSQLEMTSIAGKLQRLALLSPSRLDVLQKTVDSWLVELERKDAT